MRPTREGENALGTPLKGHIETALATDASQVSNKILTIPNLISCIRLCLVPVFVILLFQGQNIAATIIFAIAAGSDWIDGQIARHTNTVTKLGQILDPAVDRILMAAGAISLTVLGCLPLWIVLVVLIRDFVLLVGGFHLLTRYKFRIPVIFFGKAATVFLLFGFFLLLLEIPLVPGLNLFDASWLPGFGSEPTFLGIWFIYIGLMVGVSVAIYYVYTGVKKILEEKGIIGRSKA